MRLTGGTIVPLRAPLRPPLDTAQGRVATREGFVLQLAVDCGEPGLGEASPPYWIDGRPLADTRAALEAIVKKLDDCREPAELRKALLDNRGTGHLTPAAACALDTALLDLEARRRGVGVAAILGGAAQTPLPVCALLTARTPAAIARQARGARARGYTVFKLKVGAGTPGDDLENARALRGAVGQSALIRLDANRAWSFTQAVSALRAIGPQGIEFVEEPLKRGAAAELARLADAAGVAVALDESIRRVADLEAFCPARGPAPVIVLKAARVGGLSRCVEIARAARARGVAQIVVSDAIESPVGMSAAVHLAAALASAGSAVGLGGASFGIRLPGGLRENAAVHDAPWLTPCGPGLKVSPRRSRE